jgi:hypothetical protein
MSFTTGRVVLFGDCDAGGAVYTPRISDFVIEAALEFLSFALGAPAARAIMAMGVLPPARVLSIEFLHPRLPFSPSAGARSRWRSWHATRPAQMRFALCLPRYASVLARDVPSPCRANCGWRLNALAESNPRGADRILEGSFEGRS